MNDAQRVIDEIDALVEEQLAGGEPETGYDFDDPDFPECRCGLNWHGLAVYGCPGSDTEGPLRPTGLTFGRWPEWGFNQFFAETLLRDATGPNANSLVEYYESTPLYSSETSLDSASLPSRESGSVFADQIQQWQRSAAAYAELMNQQFAECWSRMVETLASRSVLLESERFHLDQWVASHDWQAEIREEPELPGVVSIAAIGTTLEDLGWRDIGYTTSTPWTHDGITRSRRGRQ